MNFKKMIYPLVFSSMMIVCSSTIAYATPVDNIRAALIRGGVPADQVSRAIEYVQRYEVTEEQANAIIAKINAASAKMNGQKDFNKVPKETRNAILKDVSEAMGYLGLKADYSTRNTKGATEMQITDGEGNKVASADYGSSKGMVKDMDVEAIKEAVIETKNMSQSTDAATFVPVDEGVLKKTGTNYGNLMLLGLTLMLSGGGTALFSSRRVHKNLKNKGEQDYADLKKA